MIKMAFFRLACMAVLCFAAMPSAMAQSQSVYVLAPSGLNLRQSADPGSAKIATLSYGAKLDLLHSAESRDMRIDNLPGGMSQVRANGTTGYIFDGYLSHFPAPLPDMSVEKYVELARKEGLEVHYESHNYDYDGYYKQEDGVTLLRADWQEAFLVAKALGNIPPKLNFPPDSKKREESFENPDKRETAWSDQMDVERDEAGNITKISYYYRGEGGGSYVNITHEGNYNGILIMIGGIAD